MSTRRIAWLNCGVGVAGDMVLGALCDAGADLKEIEGILHGLELPGWHLRAEQTSRGSIAATKVHVDVTDTVSSRTWKDISELLERAALPARVRDRSLRVFRVLAETEAALHGTPVDDVHFHEVGGHDAVIDIVGTMAALEVLEIDDVACSPIGLGYGSVAAAHGTLPAPAPATVRLLEGFGVVGVDVAFETATPTGAALVVGLCGAPSAIPGMEVLSQGFGAGTRDLPGHANVVGVILGTVATTTEQQVALCETTLDDITGEHLSHALASLLNLGALDVWVTPVVMKKGRPGHVLSVLCEPTDLARLQRNISELTGALGVRATLVTRSVLDRSFATVTVFGHDIRLKISEVSAKPEFDDVAAVAAATQRPLSEVDAAVRAIYGSRQDDPSENKPTS